MVNSPRAEAKSASQDQDDPAGRLQMKKFFNCIGHDANPTNLEMKKIKYRQSMPVTEHTKIAYYA